MQQKPKRMRISIDGKLQKGVTPKDVALFIISKLSASGATGFFIEYSGEVFKDMSMEGRMTVCNLSIEMGARGGMIAPDEKTIEYIKDREFTPKGNAWKNALKYWNSLFTDIDANFDKDISFDGSLIDPMITFGTNPGMGISISNKIPNSNDQSDNEKSYKRSLNYMNFNEGENMIGKKIDYVFLGSCTNGRIEDFRAFSKIVQGKKKADDVIAWLVPGSHKVRNSIKEEGLLDILNDAGFELREPGCSACLAMNDDKIPAGKYVISTSNRNFEGRQGPGSRTLLASPIAVAAAAITGKITDPRKYL
jgi:3-isopropylmalate/(R)-2-methylmalate dehydratase large subunit